MIDLDPDNKSTDCNERYLDYLNRGDELGDEISFKSIEWKKKSPKTCIL